MFIPLNLWARLSDERNRCFRNRKVCELYRFRAKENDAKFEQNRVRLPSRELKDILEFYKMKFFFF
ncbi:hypothetical protein DLM75_08180 [Leptospira stimsonii]|uniref:Uncharacterized protein n=1 Tax=Leptospira stimsonii TaxID=2202203 RepID=A0A396Z6P6_9LEPT|nr:hypothetical protein DLM75_08180 [Leptospira stimsonii]